MSVRDSVRFASAGHVAFAAVMIGLGVMGFASGDFAQIWQPVPKWVPGRTALVYLSALISLATGVGLLWRRSAPLASRALFIALLVWLLILRLPNLFYQTPLVLVAWSFGATAVMTAAAWILYRWFAVERERTRFEFLVDARGIRMARALCGVSLIPFGLAHFMYVDATAPLIPSWLPAHELLAYLTGAAFIAAGLAIATGVVPHLAAALSALQMGLFGLIVWLPRVIAGNVTDFQRGEFITTCALTAGAWVIADSYRALRWVPAREQSPPLLSSPNADAVVPSPLQQPDSPSPYR